VAHRVIDIFAGFGVHGGRWGQVHETEDGGGVIRPGTAVGRTFYYGITAEREIKREILAWWMREQGEE